MTYTCYWEAEIGAERTAREDPTGGGGGRHRERRRGAPGREGETPGEAEERTGEGGEDEGARQVLSTDRLYDAFQSANF